MTESASRSTDNLKLIVVGIFLIASCLTIVGAIPVGILVLGLIIAVRGGDPKNIQVTTRLVQILLLIAAMVAIVMAASAQGEAKKVLPELAVNPNNDPQYATVSGRPSYDMDMALLERKFMLKILTVMHQ